MCSCEAGTAKVHARQFGVSMGLGRGTPPAALCSRQDLCFALTNYNETDTMHLCAEGLATRMSCFLPSVMPHCCTAAHDAHAAQNCRVLRSAGCLTVQRHYQGCSRQGRDLR